MERPKPSSIAWGGLIVGIAAYDVLSPPGETLSEACHNNIEQGGVRRLLTYTALGATAFHLVNGFRRVGLPDPFGELLSVVKRD